MKFTYANVMSTIAMFAAVTTGGSYAATQLGANTVGTTQIKNGSVQAADLAPSIRKGVAAAPAAAKPSGWTQTRVGFAGTAWKCTDASSCAASQARDNNIGFQKLDIGSQYTRLRITGTLTPTSGVVPTTIGFYVQAQATPGGTVRTLTYCKAYSAVDGDAPGVSGQSYEIKCVDKDFAYTTATNKYIRISMGVGVPSGATAINVDGNIKVEAQPAT